MQLDPNVTKYTCSNCGAVLSGTYIPIPKPQVDNTVPVETPKTSPNPPGKSINVSVSDSVTGQDS